VLVNRCGVGFGPDVCALTCALATNGQATCLAPSLRGRHAPCLRAIDCVLAQASRKVVPYPDHPEENHPVFEWMLDPASWLAFGTLALLEIVLGVDNLIFISVLVSRLPEAQRDRARIVGLALALLTRIALLFVLAWLVALTAPLFEVMGSDVSGRDLILFFGGLFLLYKAVMEIHASLEGEEGDGEGGRAVATFGAIVAQIAVIDIVFSLDSVITAVGLVDELPIMVAAIVVAIGVMMVSARPIGEFVDRHPTVKMLALSFLVLVGTTLVAESFNAHVPKGYLYFAIAFSIAVEMLNLRLRRKSARAPVKLRPGARAPH
jgi:predicted tellurium resistance membrane protein TerC